MRPRSIEFKTMARNIAEYREQVRVVRWLAARHDCLFGRGERPPFWKFRPHFKETDDETK